VSQTVTGLENGTYSLSAWIQGGGGETALQLLASDYGGPTQTVDIVTTGWQEWKTPTIDTIKITDGQVAVGLKVASKGGSWALLDDMELMQVG
jgi:hypothetical protein